MSEKKTVDCRGLACPRPVVDTENALRGATTPFVVLVDSEASAANVRRFAEGQGARVSVARTEGHFRLTIEPGPPAPALRPLPMAPVAPEPATQDLVVYLASEGVGRGDDQLGGILMAAFLDTLAHFRGRISHVVCLNAGAKLAVEGSPVLEQLRQLEQIGVEVLVCGTCLNYYGIKDRLAVGSVSNMYAIVETMARAGRIIRP